MKKITYCLFLFICSLSYSQNTNICLKLKYFPFTTKTQVNFLEKDFSTLKNSFHTIQVVNSIINEDSVSHLIIGKLNSLKNDSSIYIDKTYDLRLQCLIFSNNNLIDSFYIDNSRRIVYKNIAYFKDNGLIDILLSNICRPIYSYIFIREVKYWPKETKCCFDSTEFKEVYGVDSYKEGLKLHNELHH